MLLLVKVGASMLFYVPYRLGMIYSFLFSYHRLRLIPISPSFYTRTGSSAEHGFSFGEFIAITVRLLGISTIYL